jgi:hypothetical protein
VLRVRKCVCLFFCALPLLPVPAFGEAAKVGELWILKPVVRPQAPTNPTSSSNPIDAFIAADYAAHGLKPVGPADKRTLLRRVYLDLIGLPPSPQEQEAFERDESPDAYEKVVDRLLVSEQHGVRYARHWLDVLRYADADERMTAAPGIYLWRDWVIRALNEDLPYDQFVRAQLTGYRARERTEMSATGVRSRVEPRPDDVFALGFLARGHVLRDGKDVQELAITAVDTISTAFMGLTVGCAKCHDHKLDPISKHDYYSMKALFDPLVLRKVILATPDQIAASGRARDELEKKRSAIQASLEELVAPYRKKLYDERVAMLPEDVRVIILKSEKQRTVAEQKIADDYFPVLRIDADKILEVMPQKDREKYQAFQRELSDLGGGRRGPSLPAFWTVEVDQKKALEPSYMLTSGDADRPEKDHPVEPGWPFAPAKIEFRDGRVEAFSDWLTDQDNPLFARVAVNRLWQWHFGEGLEKTPSDFGKMGGLPSNPKLLDWLASEFVRSGFSMKHMHRLIVTSDTYKLSSQVDASRDVESINADPANVYLWHFRLQRLEAEPLWDSILSAAGDLDLSVGGPSFDIGRQAAKRDPIFDNRPPLDRRTNRRAAYMIRGYSTNRDILPNFLQTFDVDDGRVPCPLRTQTVTAPQALFMMNSEEIEKATTLFAKRLEKESGGDLKRAVGVAYRITLARPPSVSETSRALEYLQNDPTRLKDFAWLMLNQDEFLYVK